MTFEDEVRESLKEMNANVSNILQRLAKVEARVGIIVGACGIVGGALAAWIFSLLQTR